MRNFKNLWCYFIIGLIGIFITACSGGACSTEEDNSFAHQFPNGVKLLGMKKVTVLQGKSSTQKFVLVGNIDFTVNLSTSLDVHSLNNIAANIECVSLCGEFNPAELSVSTTQKESSSVLTVTAGKYLPAGIYNLNLHASYYSNNQYMNDESIGVITVRVESNPQPFPRPDENGIYISNGTPSVQQGFIFATKPSESNWQLFQSGTTAGISLVASNATTTIALHGTNNNPVESAGFILTNNANGKLVNHNTSESAQAVASLLQAKIVAGSNGYLVYGNLAGNFGNIPVMGYFVDNSGVVTPVRIPLRNNNSNVQINTVAYLGNTYYAYSNLGVFSSSNGVNWSLVEGTTVSVAFSSVVELSNGVYAALADGKVYLGNSPTTIDVEQNLTYTPQQIAVYANNLALANVESSSGTGVAYLYQPTSTDLGSPTEQLSINFSKITSGHQVSDYTLSQLFLTKDSIYAVGNANLSSLGYKGQLSAAVAGDLVSTNTAIVAITYIPDNQPDSYSPLNATIQDGRLLIANTGAGIQGDLLNNVASPKYPNNGSLTLIKAIDYNKVGSQRNTSVVYNNLPTGSKYVQFMGMAGTSEHFAAIFKNGSVISYFGDKVISGATILNDSESVPVPDTIAGISAANYTLVAYANPTINQVPGSGNLYVSPDNGLTWTSVLLNTLPKAAGQGALVGATVVNSGNSYVITTFDANNNIATYRSANPAKLATWIAVNNPANTALVSLNQQLFAFASNSTNFSYESNGAWTTATTVLPTIFESASNLATQNIAYGNGVYAMVEPNSATIWTQADIFANPWTSQNISFYVNGNLFPSKTFPANNAALVWSGKVWVAIDNADFVYTSSNLTDFYVDLIGNVENAWIVGTPVLF